MNLTLKDGEEDHRYKVTTTHGNASSISILSIEKITTQDWMGYKCSAKNTYGEDEEDISLTGYSEYETGYIIGANIVISCPFLVPKHVRIMYTWTACCYTIRGVEII